MRYLHILGFLMMISLAVGTLNALGINFSQGDTYFNLNRDLPISNISASPTSNAFAANEEFNADGTISCVGDKASERISCTLQSYADSTLSPAGVADAGDTTGKSGFGFFDFMKSIDGLQRIFRNAITAPGDLIEGFFGSNKDCSIPGFDANDSKCVANSRISILQAMANTGMILLLVVGILQLLSGRSFKDMD